MGEQKRILIVEDDRLLLANLLSAATKAGHAADGATDGAKALVLLKKNTYDLLVTDIRIPSLDGIALIGRMKELSPATPFLAITGYASLDYVVCCLRYGASDFLVKPFDQETFLDSLAHSLGARVEEICPVTPGDGDSFTLSPTEKELLKWAVDSKTPKQVSELLSISEEATHFHYSRIFRKLSVKNTAEMIAKAIALKIVEQP